MNYISFGICGPNRCFGFQYDGGSDQSFGFSGQVYSMGDSIPGVGQYQGGIGVYYSFGVGPDYNSGFSRAAWLTGPYAWSSSEEQDLARGAGALAGIAGDIADVGKPGYAGWVIDQRHAAYERYLEAQKGKKKESGGAPAGDSLTARADDYFDGIVGGKKKPGEVYSSDARKTIREREKADSESNPNAAGREQALISLAERTSGWMNGDNSDVKRGEFLAQRDAWQAEGEISTERKLLGLVAPGAAEPKDVPTGVAQELLKQLGTNRVPSGAKEEDVFEAYEQMLRDRFGADYEGIVSDYFEKAASLAEGKGGVAIESVTTAEIKGKGFSDPEAVEIYARALKDKPPLAQRRLFKKLPDVKGKSGQEKAKAVAEWYLPDVREINDSDKMSDVYKRALTAKGGKPDYNIATLIGRLDDAIAGKIEPPKAGKKAAAPKPGGGTAPAAAVDPLEEQRRYLNGMSGQTTEGMQFTYSPENKLLMATLDGLTTSSEIATKKGFLTGLKRAFDPSLLEKIQFGYQNPATGQFVTEEIN